jgi:hypothetical protein
MRATTGATIDPELERVIIAWRTLTTQARAHVLAIIDRRQKVSKPT